MADAVVDVVATGVLGEVEARTTEVCNEQHGLACAETTGAWSCKLEEEGCGDDSSKASTAGCASSESSVSSEDPEAEATPVAVSDASGAEETEGEEEECQQELELAAEEDRLTKEVPKLLDCMNRASQELNALERQADSAQARYKTSVAECSKFYSELREKNGRSFDKVKPYFSAVEEVKATAHRMRAIAGEFSLAEARRTEAAVDDTCPTEILRLQQERDRLEDEYARALGEYRAAKAALEALRTQLGDAAIQRALPAFESLQQRQLKLAVEYNRMNSLAERARLSKGVYHNSMRELERISTAVHDIRRAKRERATATAPCAASER